MRRTRAVAIALTLGVVAGVPVATSTADAHTAACAGFFHIDMDTRTFGYPSLAPATTSTFRMLPAGGACAPEWVGPGYGRMSGHCEDATGWGYVDGHFFTVRWQAGTMRFEGGVTGAVQATVDPFVFRNSCLDRQGWHVLLSGPLAVLH